MTEVVIYRENENVGLIYDDVELARHRELSENLGIPVPQDNKVPNVYTVLNEAMHKQLKALCPATRDAVKYTRSTIPIEVLQALKFAKDNNMFESIEIWFDDIKPDPLLIGVKPLDGSNWQKQYYLIARWGDEALELPELLKLGTERIKQRLIDSAVKLNILCNSIIGNPDMYTREVISGKLSSYSERLDID